MESLDIILERSTRSYSLREREALAQVKNNYYRELLSAMTPDDLSPEVRDTLEQLRQRGLLLAIGSSSKNARMILDRLGLGNFFDAVSDGNGLTRSKPDPEVFIRAAALLNLPPEQCLVVEDASAGIEAARCGGFDRAGIGPAAIHHDTTYPLSSFSSLLTLL